MKKGLIFLAAAVSGLAVISSAQAQYTAAGSTFDPYGYDTAGPTILIDYTGGTSFTISYPSALGPYDGSDDTYIGIENTSSQALPSIDLSSTLDIFGFDSDGIDAYGAPGNSTDTTGYGGPESYFTGINGSATAGTVDFIGGLQPGDQTFFSLEEAITGASGGSGGGLTGSVPDAGSSMGLLGAAFVGIAALRRRLTK
jgi:hypothetical protein